MGLLDNLFGKKKEAEKAEVTKQDIAKTNEQEKAWVAKVRYTSEDLADKLGNINIVDTTNTIDEAKVEDYKQKTSFFIRYLNSGTYYLDISDLNKLMDVEDLPGKFEKAIKRGDERTADRIVKAFEFGLKEGRKERPDVEGDADKEKDIIERLKARLKEYINVVTMSEEVFDNDIDIKKIAKGYTEVEAELKKKMEDFEKLCEENHTSVKELEEIELFGKQDVSANTYALNSYRRNLINLEKEKDNKLAIMATMRDKATALEDNCRQLENLIAATPFEKIKDYTQVVKESQEAYKKYRAELQNSTDELKRLSDGINYINEEMLSSDKVINDIIKTGEEYKKLKNKIKQQEEDAEQGRKLAAERERQRQAENTNSKILNN